MDSLPSEPPGNIPTPGYLYPEKTRIQKDTYTPMFVAALLTVAKQRSNLNFHNRGADKEDVIYVCVYIYTQWIITQP